MHRAGRCLWRRPRGAQSSRAPHTVLRLITMEASVLDWRQIAQGGMTAARVIPAFDEIEQRHVRLDLGLKAAALEQFAFERGEKAFAHRIVEAVAYRAHRGPYPSLLAALTEGQRGILAALIRM